MTKDIFFQLLLAVVIAGFSYVNFSWRCHAFIAPSGTGVHAQSQRSSIIGLQQCVTNKNLWSISECLDEYRKNPSTIHFMDASWYHKGTRNGRREFVQGPRLPRAHYWDMDDIATSQASFPTRNPQNLLVMFPPKSLIEATLETMGISCNSNTNTTIIVYGREGCLFTPRLWYILKNFGYPSVGLMQGSLEEWVSAGGTIETEPLEEDEYPIWAQDILQSGVYQRAREKYRDQDTLDRLLTKQDVLVYVEQTLSSSTSSPNIKLFDTRGPSNFAKGHIPGARSIPYSSLSEVSNPFKFKSREELRAILDPLITNDNNNSNIDNHDKTELWLSCGSGVSVCHLALALEECGYTTTMGRSRPDDDDTTARRPPSREVYIYDGSWNEWGSDPATPKEVVVAAVSKKKNHPSST